MAEIGFTQPRPAQIRRLDHVLYAAGLRMQRALAVVKFLRAQTALPGNLFQVLSPGDKAAPYPNDTAANRAKNKTVVIQATLSSP